VRKRVVAFFPELACPLSPALCAELRVFIYLLSPALVVATDFCGVGAVPGVPVFACMNLFFSPVYSAVPATLILLNIVFRAGLCGR